MPRIVLDTNVLVSAFLSPDGAPAGVFEGFLEGRWELLATSEILEEYQAVLCRRKFGLPPEMVQEALGRLRQAAVLIHPWEPVQVCSDRSDDKFLACALSGKASHLVTGNARHFPKSPFRGILIVGPSEFLREVG